MPAHDLGDTVERRAVRDDILDRWANGGDRVERLGDIVVERMGTERRELAAKHLEGRHLDPCILAADAKERGGPAISDEINQAGRDLGHSGGLDGKVAAPSQFGLFLRPRAHCTQTVLRRHAQPRVVPVDHRDRFDARALGVGPVNRPIGPVPNTSAVSMIRP